MIVLSTLLLIRFMALAAVLVVVYFARYTIQPGDVWLNFYFMLYIERCYIRR